MTELKRNAIEGVTNPDVKFDRLIGDLEALVSLANVKASDALGITKGLTPAQTDAINRSGDRTFFTVAALAVQDQEEEGQDYVDFQLLAEIEPALSFVNPLSIFWEILNLHFGAEQLVS